MSEMQFDFEYWVKAYEDDPENFDELAKAYIYNYIDNMGLTEEKANKLKGLYWKVSNDPRVTGTSNGLVRAARAQHLMLQQLNKLDAAWRGEFDE